MTAPNPEPKTLAQAKRQIARQQAQIEALQQQVQRGMDAGRQLTWEVVDLRERNRQAVEILAGRD